MAQFTFVLKEPNSNEPTLIYFIVRSGNSRIKFSTGEKVNPSNWDKKTQGVKNGVKGAKFINAQLERYENSYRQYTSYIEGEGKTFSLEEFKKRLDEKFKETELHKSEASLVSFAESHIQSTDKKPNTIKHYITSLNKLKEYEIIIKKPITFDSVDLEFYYSFSDYLKSLPLAKNTVGSIIKDLKVFMDVAFENGLHQNSSYQNKRFKVVSEDTTHVYLEEDELQTIYNLDLSNNKKLESVRDYFVIGCRTGLRFSDFGSLKKKNIIEHNGRKFFQIKTVKTGEIVVIPFHAQTSAILEKYNFELPRLISNQKFNEYVKEVAQKAEINSSIVTHITRGFEAEEHTKMKYELVTVHTARRTFASLAYESGIPSHSIMKITGHRSEKAFLKYVKLSNKKHAELMAKTDFFNPMRVAL